MELYPQHALGAAAPLAGDALIGRLPGIAVFAAGLLAGALIVALASWLDKPRPRGKLAVEGPGAPYVTRQATPASPPRPALAADGVLAQPPPSAEQPSPPPAAVTGLVREAVPADGPQQGLLIGVLGPLTVNGQAGALVPAQSQLIVALALSRDGLSNAQLRRLLGSDEGHPKPADSLRQLIARTRRALGQAGDGKEWIEHLGHGRYALHLSAWVDWREFEARAAAGIAAGDPAPLEEALSLVRGQPFTGCFYWWLEPELIESVTALIVRAAESLATLRLAGQDPAAAVRAARIGLAADSSAEQLWRVMMRAEHAAGNLAGVRGAWGRCLDVASEVAADGLPDSATSAVYTELLAR